MQRQWAGWYESIIRNHLPLHLTSIFECQALEQQLKRKKKISCVYILLGVGDGNRQETRSKYLVLMEHMKEKKK